MPFTIEAAFVCYYAITSNYEQHWYGIGQTCDRWEIDKNNLIFKIFSDKQQGFSSMFRDFESKNHCVLFRTPTVTD